MDRPVLVETSQRTMTVRSVDVSGGGIALKAESTAAPLGLGDQVELYFELPIRYPIEAKAEVVRHDGELVVLRFVGLPREAELAVRSFCRISGLSPAVTPLPDSPRLAAR